jgi:hypothetical protein
MGLYFFCPFFALHPRPQINSQSKMLTISAICLFNKLVKKIKQK